LKKIQKDSLALWCTGTYTDKQGDIQIDLYEKITRKTELYLQ